MIQVDGQSREEVRQVLMVHVLWQDTRNGSHTSLEKVKLWLGSTVKSTGINTQLSEWWCSRYKPEYLLHTLARLWVGGGELSTHTVVQGPQDPI